MFHVQQRTYRQLFKFQDYSTLTGHVSFYYREPRTNVLIKLSGGRYLAKDSGFTLDFQDDSKVEHLLAHIFQEQMYPVLNLEKGVLIRVFILQFLCKHFSRIIERDIYHLA